VTTEPGGASHEPAPRHAPAAAPELLRAAAARPRRKKATDLVAWTCPARGRRRLLPHLLGRSEPQVKAIAEEVEDSCASAAQRVARRGPRVRRWVLLDFVDVVVHVFHETHARVLPARAAVGDARRWTLVWSELAPGSSARCARRDSTPGALDALELAIPRERAHGDWTTNLAMMLAKAAKQPPRGVAEAIARHFPLEGSPFAAVDVAGPGFLNFRYRDAWLAELPARVVSEGERFGRSDAGAGERILVEYVSATRPGP
jgi:ribosomal silencing factor RsfS